MLAGLHPPVIPTGPSPPARLSSSNFILLTYFCAAPYCPVLYTLVNQKPRRAPARRERAPPSAPAQPRSADNLFAAAMTPSRRAGLCVLLSLARSSGDIVEPADAPVTVTPGTYYKYTEKFSVITKDDCHIAAHDTYTSVAVGGNLYDAACGQVRRTRAACTQQRRPKPCHLPLLYRMLCCVPSPSESTRKTVGRRPLLRAPSACTMAAATAGRAWHTPRTAKTVEANPKQTPRAR